jgi:hypothetical protein
VQEIWDTGNRALRLEVSIKCTGKCTFRVIASDEKPFSKYADRKIEVDGYRTIYLSFPVTPKKLKIDIDCVRGGENKSDFIAKINETDLITYNINQDAETKQFLNLAVYFSQVAGFEKPDVNGRIFKTKDGKFNIKYFPQIVDFRTGRVLNTPARIGHNTGIIEIAQISMIKYTVAMRMIILLHEYSHKYQNPKMGLEISNEIGADINALYIYLGLGFSKVDAIYVFANVFLKAQSQSNLMRMRKIMEYIKRFENEEYAKVIK